MMVGASMTKILMARRALPTIQVVGTERVGQQLAEPSRAIRMIDQQCRSPVFVQHLTAPTARHQRALIGAHTGQCDKPSATGGMQGAHHSALGTET